MHERTRKCLDGLMADFPDFKWDCWHGHETVPGGPVPTYFWFQEEPSGKWNGCNGPTPEAVDEHIRAWLAQRTLFALEGHRGYVLDFLMRQSGVQWLLIRMDVGGKPQL